MVVFRLSFVPFLSADLNVVNLPHLVESGFLFINHNCILVYSISPDSPLILWFVS